MPTTTYEACKRINEFVDGLSNWYVRRSRDRFWAADKQSPDKLDAYWTLYECLLTTCQADRPVHAVPGRDAVAEPGTSSSSSSRFKVQKRVSNSEL